MNLGQMHIASAALHRHVTFTFQLPRRDKVGSGPYPALLLLHGASENHSAWTTFTKLPRYLEDEALVVVMPDGARSQWLNRNPHERYEDFLMQDLLPACADFFPIRPGRWGIGGYSMGGQGALYLGLKHPDRFASIYAQSSVIPDGQTLHDWMPDLTPVQLAEADITAHADRCVSRSDRPRLGFDCGMEDDLLAQNRTFHRHLERIGYPHRYAEYPGGHDWDYWDSHVRDALAHHAQALISEPATHHETDKIVHQGRRTD